VGGGSEEKIGRKSGGKTNIFNETKNDPKTYFLKKN